MLSLLSSLLICIVGVHIRVGVDIVDVGVCAAVVVAVVTLI